IPPVSPMTPPTEPPPTASTEPSPAPTAQPTPTSAPTPQPGPAPAPFAPSPMALPDILAYPKASFWERMGAGFLDIVLASMLGGFVGAHLFPPLGFLVMLAYFAGL